MTRKTGTEVEIGNTVSPFHGIGKSSLTELPQTIQMLEKKYKKLSN